jgi:hypothetical protein
MTDALLPVQIQAAGMKATRRFLEFFTANIRNANTRAAYVRSVAGGNRRGWSAGAGYEDVNDAERLCRDPAMRWVVGHQAIASSAASASQMGRFETKWLSRPENLVALAHLPGQWIDKVHRQRPPKVIVLDMDSSESPTYGDQEGSAYNGPCRGSCSGTS